MKLAQSFLLKDFDRINRNQSPPLRYIFLCTFIAVSQSIFTTLTDLFRMSKQRKLKVYATIPL